MFFIYFQADLHQGNFGTEEGEPSEVHHPLGGGGRAFAGAVRSVAPAAECLCAVLQRAFVGMHVGSDFQFPRGAAGDGPAGEPNGAEHCHQFGHGKVRRAVCDGASPHQ